MIRRVVIKNFKKFGAVTFDIPGHVVIAGPNNTGKTTMLQAIAAWSLALKEWRTLNDFNKRNGYSQKPIARQAFSAVPLRSFDLLWRDRAYRGAIEIEVHSNEGWVIAMELIADSTEQIYVRPRTDASAERLRDVNLNVVFVPSMSGLSREEPLYAVQATIDQLLGQAKPGDVLRNLLVQAHQSGRAWDAIQEAIVRLFDYELIPPNATGASIIAEYNSKTNPRPFDIASAGSGFQQVLMLLTFLNTRPASILLVDEPDAHLHIILQDAIWNELRQVARVQQSQLVIATHSEVIINSVEPRHLCVLLDEPKIVSDEQQKQILADSLRIITNTDIMLALNAPGVLYIEGRTDLNILIEWARILKHPLHELFNSRRLYWKPKIADQRIRGTGIKSTEHYDAIKLVKDLPALELVDSDANPGIQSSEIKGLGYQRLRWRRYEIESYLLHPVSLERFVQKMTNTGSNDLPTQDLRKYFQEGYPPQFLTHPFDDIPFIKNTKARTDLIPPLLNAAGLPGFPYQRYNEIAAVMLPEEIHPEVKEKLDLIQKAFGL